MLALKSHIVLYCMLSYWTIECGLSIQVGVGRPAVHLWNTWNGIPSICVPFAVVIFASIAYLNYLRMILALNLVLLRTKFILFSLILKIINLICLSHIK